MPILKDDQFAEHQFDDAVQQRRLVGPRSDTDYRVVAQFPPEPSTDQRMQAFGIHQTKHRRQHTFPG